MRRHFNELAQSLSDLRDRLGEMSLTLQDLAYQTDHQGRSDAAADADLLLSRLRRS